MQQCYTFDALNKTLIIVMKLMKKLKENRTFLMHCQYILPMTKKMSLSMQSYILEECFFPV